jgi:hypothetical protein
LNLRPPGYEQGEPRLIPPDQSPQSPFVALAAASTSHVSQPCVFVPWRLGHGSGHGPRRAGPRHRTLGVVEQLAAFKVRNYGLVLSWRNTRPRRRCVVGPWAQIPAGKAILERQTISRAVGVEVAERVHDPSQTLRRPDRRPAGVQRSGRASHLRSWGSISRVTIFALATGGVVPSVPTVPLSPAPSWSRIWSRLKRNVESSSATISRSHAPGRRRGQAR